VAVDGELVARFVRDGFVTINTTLPAAFHAELCQRAGAILDREGNWGNNILPRLPELQRVLDDPPVASVLATLLGPSYAIHPHRYCHRNEPGSTGQRLHKDTRDFSGDHHLRHHRPRWLIAFYYPQDVTPDMGPTAIVPRSQYYLDRPDDAVAPEIQLCMPGGTVAFVHFGMWHRATANLGTKQRYMFKFEFGRMDDPLELSDDRSAGSPLAFEPEDDGRPAHLAAWSHIGDWLRGATSEATVYESGLPPDHREVEAVQNGDERVQLDATYALAAGGEDAATTLGHVLRSSSGRARRYAAFGLTALGRPAVDTLMDLASDADDDVRITAIDALGDIGRPAWAAAKVLGLSLESVNPWERRYAAEALGLLGSGAADCVPGLTRLLGDEQAYVRMNVATALARIGPAAVEAVPSLVNALTDEDRYTRAWASIALRRVGTPEATSALLDHLEMARWCATTTPENRY
jgi:HEAT repeat protein